MKKFFFTFIFIFIFINNHAQVGIGTTSPNSTLTVNGSISTAALAIPFAITLDENYHTVFGSDITLPDPTNIIGREYIIKTDGDPGTITAAAGDMIDESSSISLNPWESIVIKAIGAGEWLIVGGKFDDELGAEEINELTDAKFDTSVKSLYLGQGAGLGATGSQNTGVGAGALLNANGSNNIALGYLAGDELLAGDNNIFLGHSAGAGNVSGLEAGTSNILIGYNVQTSAKTATSELNIGDAVYATGLYGATAKVGIGTNNPSAGLEILGTDTGAPVLELNPQSAPVGTATGQLAVIGDLLYMYDATRSKWLSVESTALQFAKNNRQAATEEFLFFGGNLRDGTKSGALMPFDGTVVVVSARRADTDTSAETYLVSINGSTSLLPGNSIEFTSGSQSVNGTAYNIDFNAGDFLNVYTSLSRISYDPAVIVWVKWRK